MNDNQQDQIERYLDQRKKQEEPGEMSGQEQKRKINFIKQHIVDYYHADQQIQQLFAQYFLNYLKENKGINTQEHNLDLLSFDEIEDIVNGFQKMNPLKIIQEKRKNRISQSVVLQQKHNYLQQDKVQMKDWNARKVYYSNGAWDYELNGYQQCKREKAYFLQNSRKANKIQIAFSKYETKKSGGFFGIGSTLQLWISMKGPIIKEQVARTAEDFIFLRQALKYTVPFSYIPPLDINENTLKKVDNEEIRAAILKQCLSFINAIRNNEELIQNFYTFRFFTEIKYQNYLNLKKSFKQPIINHTKLLKNRQGCVEIQISDRNQLLKKDYGRKSQHLQKIWRFVGESNSKIEQKMKQIQTQINFQKKELKAILEDIGNSNQILKSASYEKLTEVLCCYNDVYKVYQENMMNIRQFFRSVSKRLSNQAQKNWKAFSDYKDYVFQYSNEYQARRKGFLQKGLPKPGKTQQPINKQKNSKISIMSDLGIDDASEREITWIQRYSKWQAYINRKFVLCFEDLVDSDRETLRDIMQTTAQKTLQFRGKEQISFISHLSVISA